MHPGDLVAERFEILLSAGSGGMGAVYQARDRETGGLVALKVLVAREAGLTARFAQEVALLSAVEHPHVVGYVTHGFTSTGSPFLVMPWLQGQDLQERIRKAPLSVAHTLTIARCVAEALACLHARGIVHRDLKPSNIFLPDGDIDRVQVIDLGIARATAPLRPSTLSGVLLGTPGFIAPEQACGEHDAAPTVDIFALGCVLFECLTGTRLFDGAHVMAVLAKILIAQPPRVRELRPEVPGALDLLIHKMVSKDPRLRPRDGAQLVEWLTEIGHAPLNSGSQPPNALTADEQRVITILVVALSPTSGPTKPAEGIARATMDSFTLSSERFGVRVHVLTEHTAVVLAPDGLSATDQAAVLARFGRFVGEAYPAARVALATGTAVTGARLPVGEAIDRGVTMMRGATPGQGVHLDEVSAALIASRFDVRTEGGHLLLEDERLSLDPTRPLLGRPTPCVGRERELLILDATFATSVEGAGPEVVLVTAAAGAGKSRLRHEFLRRLREAPGTPPKVLQSRGDPLRSASPYAQLAQLLRQAADLPEHAEAGLIRTKLRAHVTELLPAGEVTRVCAFLGELLGVPFEDEGLLALRAARHSAEAMADQIRVAFEDAMRAWCAKEPLILVLEDLHWGDVASFTLLDAALRKLKGAPLLVLALARPELHERFPGLWQHRHVTEVRLPPLTPRAAAKLVHHVIGEHADSADVLRMVERSEGNAFYLEELIRAAASRAQRGSSPPPGPHHDQLPQTVIAVAQARLERLEPGVRKVLRAASIFGEYFSVAGVSALVGEDAAALESIVNALIEQETIAPLEQPRVGSARSLSFRHALLRAAAYATLTSEDRVLGHRLAALWLEEAEEDREVVALHWLEAGDRRRAAACFAEAGEARWARAQAEAAARCIVRSLLVGDASAEDPQDLSTRIRLLADSLEATRRIDAREVMTGLERHVTLPEPAAGPSAAFAIVEAALSEPLFALRALNDPSELSITFARAACAAGALSNFSHAKGLLGEATALAGDNGIRRQSVHYASAKIAFWVGEYGAVSENLSATLLPADDRERVSMLLLLATAVVCEDGGEALSRGLDFVSRAEALVDAETGNPVAHVQCLKARFLCFAFAGNHLEAVRAAEAAVAISRRGGLRYEECIQLHNTADMYLRLGERVRARAAVVASNEIARDIGADRLHLQNEPILAFLDGRVDRLEQLVEDFCARKESWHEMHARYWLGHLVAAAGSSHARRELGRALDLARRLKVRTMADECERTLAALPAEA